MNPTVLFVDDEPQVTRSLAVNLRREPYHVLTANTPREALDLLGRGTVDIVVTDEHMPGMSGNDLLARICEASPATVRVMLTGAGTLETAMEAINSGNVFRYLQKPCSRTALLACLAAAAQTRMTLLRVAEAQAERDANLRELAAFERALGGLWVATQPVVRPSRRATVAYEALVRTLDPAFPNAGAFLAAAEHSGRVPQLDRLVRMELAKLAPTLPEGTSLFVNVPAATLKEDWFGTVADPLATIAQRVVLEITEEVTVDQILGELPKIEAARALGFRIAIDDLGAGQAGLGALARLQPDIAKVDRGLVRDIDRDPVRRKLARGLAAICRELDIEILAEGVETVAEYEVFRDAGYDLFQGYLFARPGRGFPVVSWPDTA